MAVFSTLLSVLLSFTLSAQAKPAPKATPSKRSSAPRGKAALIKRQSIQARPIGRTTGPVIRPKAKAGPVTSFELVQTGPGKLALRFVSRDPNLELAVRSGFIAQLYGDPSLGLEPSMLTQSQWPSGAKSVNLRFKGVGPGQVNGEVAYQACHRKTKACTSLIAPVSLAVRP